MRPCLITVPKSYCPDPETFTTPEIAGASIFHKLLMINYYIDLQQSKVKPLYKLYIKVGINRKELLSYRADQVRYFLL